MSTSCRNTPQYIPLSYNFSSPNTSRLELLYALFPSWPRPDGSVEFKPFSDGTTNVLLKAVHKTPDDDNEAVLLRVYGKGTDILVDREREFKTHCLLSQYNLAPPLLARFENGLFYRFVEGEVCKPQDLGKECVWCGVARKLGEWHGVLPIGGEGSESAGGKGSVEQNIWTVMQRWISALPTVTPSEAERRATLQQELDRLVLELGTTTRLVFGHCDLLSGNIILHPTPSSDVTFIDYEYSLPCPAAFDLANHFSEWAGFECNYSLLPTRSVRREFLKEYVRSYNRHSNSTIEDEEELFEEVDRFRGVPGFFWGLCALVQHVTEEIEMEFECEKYSEMRLGEYWAWRGEDGGVRERRWAEE
ncbi:kinase-like protein [Wilcoxina mikolae CBS 423.85]|nr:kinase-like protein [Wilcoxina mikolae CBS 423.85]